MWPLTVATMRSITCAPWTAGRVRTLTNQASATAAIIFFFILRTQSIELDASEWLAYAEKEIEMTQALRLLYRKFLHRVRIRNRVIEYLKIPGRVQVISKVKTQRAYWSLISYT